MGQYDIELGQLNIDKVGCTNSPIYIEIRDANGKRIDNAIFRVQTVQGQEALSQPFEFGVDLAANDNQLDKNGEPISIEALLNASITIGYVLPSRRSESKDGSEQVVSSAGESEPRRYFNGVIADFSLAAPGAYKLTIKPALWRASLTNRYQLYQGKTIQAVIQEVLDAHEVSYEMHLDSVAVDREQDWIQTGETDLEFVQRLMHKANIYYYFVHSDSSHVMVIANAPQYKTLTVEDGEAPLSLHYVHSSEAELHSQEDEHITDYIYKKTFSSSGVHSILLRSEAVWESDSIAGYSKYESTAADVYRLPFREYKVFQYGGSYDEVEVEGNKSWQMIQSAATSLSGSSTSSLLSAGHTFTTMNNSEVSAPAYRFGSKDMSLSLLVRPELEGVSFVVTQVQHKISLSEPYSNSFEATQSDMLITPFSIQNTQQGMILAEVVADETAEYPTGWMYREKPNFYMEPHSAKDKAAPEVYGEKGVFVKFATDSMAKQSAVWVKLAQHMQTVPEVGVTVSIGRSSDESELPEIQSVVQSNGSKVIMPSGWQANTNVGGSYSTSFGDSKGIRFGQYSNADLDAAIAIVERSYKTGKFKDTSYSQGASYSYSTAEEGKDGLLSESETYGSTDSKYYGGYTISYSEIDRSESESIIGSSYSKSTIDTQESDTTINGTNKSTTLIKGKTISNTTHTADISSTNNIMANQTSNSFTSGTVDSKSQTIGATSNMNMFVGAKNNMDLSVAASNNMAVSASISNDIAVTVGLNNVTKVNVAASINTEINAVASISNCLNLFESKNKTTPLEVITEPANVKARIGNIDVEIMTFKIFM